MIELRIPWGLLLFSDPSQMQVFAGTDQQWRPLSKRTPGISVAAFEVGATTSGGRARKVVTGSLPPVLEGQLAEAAPLYTWQPWNQVQFRPYFKQSYFALQKMFAELTAGAPQDRVERRDTAAKPRQ